MHDAGTPADAPDRPENDPADAPDRPGTGVPGSRARASAASERPW